MTNLISKRQKYLNYKEQHERLKKAMKNGFYLEAIFIEYSILEDRTESILRYTDNFEKLKSKNPNFISVETKLKKIKTLTENKRSIEKIYFKPEFIDSLFNWENLRNGIIHALMKRTVLKEEIENVAISGLQIVKDLSRISTNYKHKLEKLGLLNA